MSQDSTFANSFLLYCVDPEPGTGRRNDDLLKILDIQSVPTLVYQNEKFVGQDSFVWLQTMIAQVTGGGGGGGYYEEQPHHAPQSPPQMGQMGQMGQMQQMADPRYQQVDPRME